MKNTRLFYTDDKNLEIYKALPPQDFKEIFMKMLTYKLGDKVEIDEFTNPMNYALFLSFKEKIDYNEAKWENKAKASKENGKKGGRPKKETISNENNTNDLSVYTPTDEKDIITIENNAINNPETPNNDELTEEQQKKVEDIYNSYSFQTRVIDQIGKKDREDIETEFVNILRGNDIYDYNDKVYLALEKTLF